MPFPLKNYGFCFANICHMLNPKFSYFFTFSDNHVINVVISCQHKIMQLFSKIVQFQLFVAFVGDGI